jgi:hypothetical protein
MDPTKNNGACAIHSETYKTVYSRAQVVDSKTRKIEMQIARSKAISKEKIFFPFTVTTLKNI